jgi:hypothetical protein
MRLRAMSRTIAAMVSALGLLVATACAAPESGGASPLPECPPHWGGRSPGDWVPALGSGSPERLMPSMPLEADICAYDAKGSRASAPRRLTDGLTTMVTDLNHLPLVASPAWRACTLIGSLPESYLVRLRYSNDQVSWIGTAYDGNRCVTTTNGARTMSYIGDAVKEAYNAGRWPSLNPADPCEPGRGRVGQDTRMAPPGTIGLTVCQLEASATATQRKEFDEEDAKKISGEISARPAKRDDGSCPTGAMPALRLIFRYAQGPPAGVTVWTKGCGMDNDFLRSDMPPALIAELSGFAG